DSERITVLIETAGSTPLNGTRYDADINSYFKNNSDVQKNSRMPFVVVLRAKSGEYIGHTVNASQWPVELPAFPPEPEIVEAPKPKAEEAPKPAPRPVVPSLIVIGKKPETNAPPPVVVPQPQASETKPLAATTNTIASPVP